MEGAPPTPGSIEEIRCSTCGALMSPDAEWCGQCFTPLKPVKPSRDELAASIGIKINEAEPSLAEPEPAAEVSQPVEGAPATPAASRAPAAPKPRLTWPCPACEHDNDIQLNRCERCGTPFAALMKADEVPVRADPKDAVTWSLIYPGLGHRKAGRPADGIARGTLFTLSLILLIIVALSGLGSIWQVIMVTLYLLTTLTVYAGSAAEAYRIAQGGAPFLSARTLLWATVGLLLVSIALLAITATALVRR